VFALGTGHKSALLCTLHHLGTSTSSHKAAVLKESLVSGKAVREVLERQQSQAPDLAASKLALVLHSIGSPEDPITMKPALMKLAFVSVLKMCKMNHHIQFSSLDANPR